MKQQIDFIEKEYNNFLEVEKILNKTQDSFKKHFKISEEEKDWKLQNLNPLRYEHDIETGMKKVRDNVIRMVIQLFKEDYPNVDLDDKDFEDSILTFKNKWGHDEKGLKIDFDTIRKKIKELEENADGLAKDFITKQSLRLIPWVYKDKGYKKEEILKGDKLMLYCGYSFSYPDREFIPYLLKLISILVENQKPSNAEETNNVFLKYYKNGRLDVKFSTENSKEDADKVAEYLVKAGNKKK